MDGFPRNTDQARALDKILKEIGIKLTSVITIKVENKDLIKRICGRICKRASIHKEFRPPVRENICDNCGSELYQRADDNEATVGQRLAVYESKTKPLIDYYKESGSYCEIDGNQSMEDVYKHIEAALEKASK